MEIPESLVCLFNGQVEERDGSYVVEVPKQELDLGTVQEGEVHRVAVSPVPDSIQKQASTVPTISDQGESQSDEGAPVTEGDIHDVEIEDLGEKGDGITRIGPGYVVFVSDTEIGDQVRIEITDARDNFAFADVLESRSTSV